MVGGEERRKAWRHGKATYGEAGGRGPDTRPFDIEDGGFIDIASTDQTERWLVREVPAIGSAIARTSGPHMLMVHDRSAGEMHDREAVTHLATT